MKTNFYFDELIDCEDGKIAFLETAEERITVGVFINSSSEMILEEGEPCCCEVYGEDVGTLRIYHTEEESLAEKGLAPKALIPMGAFPLPGHEDEYEPSPTIIFSGEVLEVRRFEGKEGYMLIVKTLGMVFALRTECKEEISAGDFVKGVAWLFGKVERGMSDEF